MSFSGTDLELTEVLFDIVLVRIGVIFRTGVFGRLAGESQLEPPSLKIIAEFILPLLFRLPL